MWQRRQMCCFWGLQPARGQDAAHSRRKWMMTHPFSCRMWPVPVSPVRAAGAEFKRIFLRTCVVWCDAVVLCLSGAALKLISPPHTHARTRPPARPLSLPPPPRARPRTRPRARRRTLSRPSLSLLLYSSTASNALLVSRVLVDVVLDLGLILTISHALLSFVPTHATMCALPFPPLFFSLGVHGYRMLR